MRFSELLWEVVGSDGFVDGLIVRSWRLSYLGVGNVISFELAFSCKILSFFSFITISNPSSLD